MKGCRSLTDDEVRQVYETLGNERDRCLFVLGLRTGLRISELLSLRVKDVWENEQVTEWVTVSKANTKGRLESKTLPLAESARKAIQDYLSRREWLEGMQPLFRSTKGRQAITRVQAHRVLKAAFNRLGLTGKLATHAMRKTFAHKIHNAFGGKIEKTQQALCHKSLSSTASYIQVDREEVVSAILGLR